MAVEDDGLVWDEFDGLVDVRLRDEAVVFSVIVPHIVCLQSVEIGCQDDVSRYARKV